MFPRGHPARYLDEGHVRMLTEHGWTGDDFVALLDDWPTTASAYWVLTRFVTDTVFAGANPAQARQWARLMLEVTATAARLVVTPTVRALIADRTNDPRHAPVAGDLVTEYALAADGEHDLALAAYAAGLTADEIVTEVAAGRLDVKRLWALAALRGVPRPVEIAQA